MNLLPDNRKIIKRLQAERMTYGFWLRETNKLPVGTLSILINSDIYLNETAQYLIVKTPYIQEHKKFIALSRYNPDGDGFRLNEDPHWTQDAWAVVRSSEDIPSALIQEASFELGQPGCDNKIAYVMHSYGYRVTNPCDFVKTIHLQADMRRSYDARGNKLLGIHAFVHPTLSIEDDSKLDFDLLIRNNEPIPSLRVNNWINFGKDYQLSGDPQQLLEVQSEIKRDVRIYQPEFELADSSSQYQYVSTNHYDYIDTKGFIPKSYFLTHHYSDQYQVYEDQVYYYFYDKYWPTVRRIKRSTFPDKFLADPDLDQLFYTGFLPAVLEIDGLQYSEHRRLESDNLFWQRPCKTEEDAYHKHQLLDSPQVDEQYIDLYIPMPWATIIDLYKFHPTMQGKSIPWGIAGVLGIRISSAKQFLESRGKTLRVHTVCQQIYWQEILECFKWVGITDLWIAHKTTQIDSIEGIRLHAWPLFAVNVADPQRRSGLKIIPIVDRPFLASFIGAYMNHYISSARLKIAELLGNHPDYRIKLNDMWHFNELVYNEQLNLEVEEFVSTEYLSVVEYNQTLSNSKFSLCPIGAGYNTLRLWESLAIGSIPVILSDGYELPTIEDENGKPFDWTKAILQIPEAQLPKLDAILRAVDDKTLQAMSHECQRIYAQVVRKTCFGKLDKELEVKTVDAIAGQKMKIFIPYIGENDRYFWRNSKHGFYDLVMEWHKRGWCDIQEHKGPYYWINNINSILFFDRDQVADLIDKKRVNPRWHGEVPYQYAFFTNEYNLENDRNFKFEYWSYHPVELEDKSKSMGVKSYQERTIDSIFLASIENETQEYFRNKFQGWETAIDEFYIADKLNKKESAKYSFEEYLEKISHAKFGVCMRGNGPKCYREVEYAAFGTPLIITEGVDTNYPVPLIEGTHYFFAKNKEDIEKYVKQTDEKTWLKMSLAVRKWYEENFTTEAMFNHLKDKIETLDLSLKKPSTVFIEPIDHEQYQLTYDSCKIFNPNVNIVKTKEENISGVTLKAGDIVINELPYLKSKQESQYCVNKDQLDSLREDIIKSNLQKNKDLATLLKWRLRDFKVKLKKQGNKLEVEKYIDDHGLLRINDPAIEYEISIDYDYQRRLSHKYLEKNIFGKGVISFPMRHVKKVILHYNCDQAAIEVDITKPYAEYVALNDSLMTEEVIWRAMKLWEYETKKFEKIDILLLDDSGERMHTHSKIEFYPI
ncbi:exostosin family protein [Polynucleobacter paneuropaeus]|nr:exostosin family protein [Polynucleobacter paneuropaeus]